MSVRIPLDAMTTNEKLKVMEDIWSDLRGKPENVPSPEWHREVLTAREQKRGADTHAYDDWAVAKERIRKQFDY